MKNLFIVIILLTLLILGCGDTVSTQLNAENYKNQLDDARRENAGLHIYMQMEPRHYFMF